MENKKLKEAAEKSIPWKKWGPYLSERQWGTVREDYSAGGDAWNYFTHDMARSRAYQWGEDGLAGISDDKQQLCFALALWNGRDPILKERLFGLTNGEGNHGEDVKEYYFYLDSTPTHSYMKYLYKYPQRAYPYLDLINSNRNRGHHEREFELMDTGIFDDGTTIHEMAFSGWWLMETCRPDPQGRALGRIPPAKEGARSLPRCPGVRCRLRWPRSACWRTDALLRLVQAAGLRAP